MLLKIGNDPIIKIFCKELINCFKMKLIESFPKTEI